MFSKARPLISSFTSGLSFTSGGGPGQQPPRMAFHKSKIRWVSVWDTSAISVLLVIGHCQRALVHHLRAAPLPSLHDFCGHRPRTRELTLVLLGVRRIAVRVDRSAGQMTRRTLARFAWLQD